MKASLKLAILLPGISRIAAAQPVAATEAPWPASTAEYYYTLIGFVLLVIVGYTIRRAGQSRRSFRR